jgi:hypothetical protein
MRTKRKRVDELVTNAKRLKASDSALDSKARPLSPRVLSFCYLEVLSLRQFLINSLPSTSRVKRRKLTTVVLDDASDFLDTTFVGISRKTKSNTEGERRREFVTFTQSQQRSTRSSNATPEEDHLAEVSPNLSSPASMVQLADVLLPTVFEADLSKR